MEAEMSEQMRDFWNRHGELAVAAIVENWERFQGRKVDVTASIEERFRIMMGGDQERSAA
jgi:hypothetical protein